MRGRTAVRMFVLAAAASGAISCAAAVEPQPVTHTVTMEAVSFKPESLTVTVGDRILWVNTDPFPHTATTAGTFDSREMTPDASWAFHAAVRGEIRYVCAYHPTMKGTIVVR